MTFTATFGTAACNASAYNPFNVVPSDPALAALHTPETRTMNNPDVAEPVSGGRAAFFPRGYGDS